MTSFVGTRHAASRRPTRPQGLPLAALALVLAVGCSTTTSTNPGDLLGIAGTFKLVQMNDAPLPYTEDSTTWVVRGSATIHSTQRYDFVETDSTAAGLTNLSSSGQWTIANNALTLQSDDNQLYLATLSGHGDTLRLRFGTHLGTYVKQ